MNYSFTYTWAQGSFWFYMFGVQVACLLPVLAYQYVSLMYFPSNTDIVRERDVLYKSYANGNNVESGDSGLLDKAQRRSSAH